MENKSLKQELALLKAVSSESTTPSPQTGIAVDLEHVKTLAEPYTALYKPFLTMYNDLNLFTTPQPLSTFLLPEQRFCTNKNVHCNSQLAQLYGFLLEHLHGMVRDYSEFEAEVSSACSHTLVGLSFAVLCSFKSHVWCPC